MWNVLF
jgi:hypothetical protein